MNDPTKPEWSEYDLMLRKLPYTLTEGVTATREGLRFDSLTEAHRFAQFIDAVVRVMNDTGYDADVLIDWPDAAERLRYREGGPYCELYIGELGRTGFLRCEPPFTNPGDDCIALHRLAAILCDDAEAFRVLHWCVHVLST